MSSTHYEVKGNTAVITLNNPPVNGLGYDLRASIAANVAEANQDTSIEAIVITGTDRAFSGGADIREFGSPKSFAEPNLSSVIKLLENSSKPVIAAIGGVCMGGGLELALGAHYRVALPTASLALPEIKLGLMPGAGGTQRFPRVVGLEHALNFILSGNTMPAIAFKGTALIDEYIEGDIVSGAITFAKRVITEKMPLKKIRYLTVEYPNYEGFLDYALNTVKTVTPAYPAPSKVVDALTAAVSLPFDAGMKVERDAFLELMGTAVSRSMRHAFLAERACAKIPDIPDDTPTRSIATVGVVGAGTMGGGISMNFLNAGIPVTLLETKQEALDKGVATIRRNYENTMKKGKLSLEELEKRMSLLTTTLSYDDFKDVDLIIEAVFEEMSVKETVFKSLDKVAKPGAILASNTSTLDVNQIASFTTRPKDVIGTHFFSPANVMKLLEVVRGKETSKDVLASIMKLSKKIKKTAVVSGVCDGFIGNRMLEHYVRMAGLLLEQGATPPQVDKAMEKWGMIMGPFRMGDLAGNDIGWAIRKRRYIQKPHIRYAKFADVICEQGRYGQKTGKGWYLYEAGNRKPIPDPELDQLLITYRKEKGITPRKISDEEIVQFLIYALVNEAARILEEGIALRASDVDIVYLTGYGFPVFRGGPMRYADEVGLYQVAQKMSDFKVVTGDNFWEPADLIKRLIAEGKSFT